MKINLIKLTMISYCRQILGCKLLSEPKPLDQVKGIVAKKRKFDEEMQSIFGGEEVPSEPFAKKLCNREDK